MKLKNFKVKKYTLLKLYLLKYQAHKINFQSSTSKTIDYIELCLKQALNLIYLYHSSNKRILFIGFPYIKNKLILKDSQHFFLQKSLWTNGLLGNNDVSSTQGILSMNSSSANKTFDLVVLFNASIKDLPVLKELSSIGYPLVVLGSQISLKSINTIYTVPAFLLKKNMKQLCSFLIYSILRKSKKQNKLTKLLFKKRKK
jgi:hypothetical protein|tara:strand:- start:4016 stop:4615 length:600 start_codon:yes stop_codon:yes gene_type:complete